MQELRFKFLFTTIWYCFSILYFSFHGPGGKVKLRLRAISRHWPLSLNNMIRDSWQHLAGSFTTFLKIHFGEKIPLIGCLYLLSNVSWLFKRIKSDIVNNSSRGQWTKQKGRESGIQIRVTPFSYKNPVSRGTIWRHLSKVHTFDESISELFPGSGLIHCYFVDCLCSIFVADLCSVILCLVSILQIFRLLFAPLFHKSLNWKVGSAWLSYGRKGDAKATQSPGKWIQTVALKQYLFCFVFLYLSN